MTKDTLIKIKKIMDEKNMSAEELSEKTGLKSSCTNAIKAGTRKKFSLYDLVKVSNALNVDIRELVVY